jgi:hypothetical protein
MIPLSSAELDKLRTSFLAEEDTFLVDIAEFVVKSQNVIMFGSTKDWDKLIETKLSDIITKNPLVVRTPLDKEKLLVGNNLNTGATIKMVFDYNLATLGNPDNIIIFRY